MRERTLWLTIFPLTLAVILVGWALTEPEPADPYAASVITTPATVPTQVLCREFAVRGFEVADELDRAFRVHAHAHHAWRAGEIPYGPRDRPGTVLFIWKKTLQARERHATHYHELRDAYREDCLT